MPDRIFLDTSCGPAAKHMRDQEKKIDPLPDTFESEEAAGEFWDTHSLIGYERYLQPANEEVEISET